MRRIFALLITVCMLFVTSMAFAVPLAPQIVPETGIATPIFVDVGFAWDCATSEWCMITSRQIEVSSYTHWIKSSTSATKPIIRSQVVDPASYGASEVPISNPGEFRVQGVQY